jgi:hypothetical protein
MTTSLRSNLIRLAHTKPELRPHLLPLLTKQAAEKAPKDVLEENSDNYFVQFVAPLITKASMTAGLKSVKWAPRGKGSLDKKSKGTHGLLDFLGTPHQSPLEFHLSGSYMTQGDGMASIFLKSIGKGTAEDRFKMTGDPAADAKKFVESIKDLCEDFNPKQGKTANDIGKTILDQMGGWRRISAMIGAKNAVYLANGVHFAWPSKQPSKGNSVKITLGGDDLYTVEFVYERNLTFKTVAKYTGIYADGLVSLFEKQTGYYLKF